MLMILGIFYILLTTVHSAVTNLYCSCQKSSLSGPYLITVQWESDPASPKDIILVSLHNPPTPIECVSLSDFFFPEKNYSPYTLNSTTGGTHYCTAYDKPLCLGNLISSMEFKCTDTPILIPENPTVPKVPNAASSQISMTVIILCIVGAGVLFLVIMGVNILVCRRRKNQNREAIAEYDLVSITDLTEDHQGDFPDLVSDVSPSDPTVLTPVYIATQPH